MNCNACGAVLEPGHQCYDSPPARDTELLRLRAENERLRGEVADLRMHQDSMAELISRQVLSLAQRDAVIAETSQRLQKAEAVCEAAERYRISIDNQRGWTSPAELDAALAAWREGING